MSKNDVAEAVAGVKRAETDLDAAQARLDEARETLDARLAARGWIRMGGAFAPGVRLYESAVYPSAALNVDAVVRHLEQLAAATS